MIELNPSSHLLEMDQYKYELQDVAAPQGHMDHGHDLP